MLQGSTLGPILFLYFINDLSNATDLFSLLFADDACILASDKNLKTLTTLCNIELKKIANWMMANKLAVNTSKCKYIIFHNRSKTINPEDSKILFNWNEIGKDDKPEKIVSLGRTFNNHANIEERSYKYLGIYLDENFSLNQHFEYLCKKLSKGLFCLRRAKNLVNKKSLKTLYYSLFHSHLLYCTNILNCTNNANVRKVTVLQKKAIRIIENANYNDHTAPLFIQSGILPFEKILLNQKILFMHGIIHKHNNRTFENIWRTNEEREIGIDLRNANDLTLPTPHFEGFKKFPIFDFAKSWNEIGDMKYQSNFSIFKTWLKKRNFCKYGTSR